MGLYSVFLAIGQIIGALIGGFAAEAAGIDGMLVATGGAAPGRAAAAGPPATGRGPGDRDDRLIDGHPWSPVPLARGARGAVVAPHHLATAAGLHVLRTGGSAVDAAIATNAVLGVVMPNGCGIGGDAFWLIWDAASGTPGRAQRVGPERRRGIDAATLRERGLTTMPRRGPLTITVPGAVRSWGDAHERFGRLTPDARCSPRPSSWPGTGSRPGTGSSTPSRRPSPARSRTSSVRDAGFAAVYRPHGRPWRPGERVRLPALADTLETLARDGLRRLLRRRPRRAPGARPGRRRLADPGRGPARAHARPGASRSRSTTAASA